MNHRTTIRRRHRTLVLGLLIHALALFPGVCAEEDGGADAVAPIPSGSQGPWSVYVAKPDFSDYSPPEGSFDLLEAKLRHVLGIAGNYGIAVDEKTADMVLHSSLVSWELRTDPDLLYVAEMGLRLALEGKIEDRIVIPSIGIGDTAYSAAAGAVEDATVQYLYHLKNTELWKPDLRIIDMLAGKAVLNMGRDHGARRGMEFVNARALDQEFGLKAGLEAGGGDLVLLRIQEVYETYSEAYVLSGPEAALIGTPLEEMSRLGLMSSFSVRYIRYFDGTEAESSPDGASRAWAAGTRVFFDRGLFSLNPLIGIDFLSEKTSLASAGMALNWHVRRMTYVPAAGVQIGFPGLASPDLLWGGFIEFGIRRLLGRKLLLKVDAGASSLYFTGGEEGDTQFLYAGAGLILKY